jgi:hypothetical protein
MALSSAQKARIRYYLGYSDVSQGGGPNRLEMAMSALTTDAQTIVEDLLTKLAATDTDAVSVSGANRAGIIEVDNGGVKWAPDGKSAASAVSRQGSIWASRLAVMFGVELGADVFGAGGIRFGTVGMT